MIFGKKPKGVSVEQHTRVKIVLQEKINAKEREIQELKDDNVRLLKNALENAQQKAHMLQELKRLIEINRKLLEKLREK